MSVNRRLLSALYCNVHNVPSAETYKVAFIHVLETKKTETWPQAQTYCKDLQLSLWTIRNEAENVLAEKLKNATDGERYC